MTADALTAARSLWPVLAVIAVLVVVAWSLVVAGERRMTQTVAVDEEPETLTESIARLEREVGIE